jgi:hypothetical protein
MAPTAKAGFVTTVSARRRVIYPRSLFDFLDRLLNRSHRRLVARLIARDSLAYNESRPYRVEVKYPAYFNHDKEGRRAPSRP